MSASADTQYWVAVGSYSSLDRAEKGRDVLAAQLTEPVSIATADADGMPRYRVVTGPFSSRDMAEGSRLLALASGIADAWVLATRDELGLDAGGLADYASDQWSTDDEGDADLDAQALGGQAEALAPREKRDRTLVEEAPEDYQLHRLRRR